MKKGNKPIIVYLLIMLVITAVVILAMVGVKLKTEELSRLKLENENRLNTERGKHNRLTADFQLFTAEERIVNISINELGMIRRKEPIITLTYNKEKTEEIELLLNQKYD